MKKRSLAILLAGLLAFNIMPINGIAATVATGGTEVTRDDFEDENLWYSIVDEYWYATEGDECGDELDASEIQKITILDVREEEIKSLKGLENLTSLETLICESNNIEKIGKTDLPQSLKELYCGYNDLTEIEALPDGLEILQCQVNKITKLPKLPSKLKMLNCRDNEISEMPELPNKLVELFCSNNMLTELKLNPNVTYNEIDVSYNYMKDTNAITGKKVSWDKYVWVDANDDWEYIYIFAPQREHDHDYTITTIKEPTCTETGLDKYTCDCGEESTEVTSALGHRARWRNLKAATCTENGYSGDYVCINCNAVVKQGHSTEKLAHTGVWTLTKEATVNYEGTEEQKCASCGTVLATRSIPATGKYTVKYVLNGGTNNAKNPVKYNKGKKITLKKATKAGYTFKGWYTDKKCTRKATAISKKSTGNKTFYAKWEKVNYKITYQLNKGKNNKKNPKSYTVTSKKITLKNPTRKGYKFMGWYSDKKMTKKVTNIAKGSTGKVTLYAKWAKK